MEDGINIGLMFAWVIGLCTAAGISIGMFVAATEDDDMFPAAAIIGFIGLIVGFIASLLIAAYISFPPLQPVIEVSANMISVAYILSVIYKRINFK